MPYRSASSIRHSLLNQDQSVESLLNSYYQHIDQHNPKVNALVVDMRERALAQAKALDQKSWTNDTAAPLHGVPISIKEAFNISGYKTTVNFPPLKDNQAQETSRLVKRLEDAGAIVVGKTNVPLMLSDSQTFGPLFPTCNNPYDVSRVPGGSTGGGAAAVASGMSCFELGSDIGGSIRNPAHYCGLFGLKPTHNGHSHDGHVPPLPGRKLGFAAMNCTGPLARTIEDLKLAYDIAYQPDWSYLKYLPVNAPANQHADLSGYRIGWYDQIGPFQVNQNTKQVMQKVISSLTERGAKVEKITLDQTWCREIYEIWATLFGLMAGQDMNWLVRQILKFKFRKDIKGSQLSVYEHLKQGLNLNFKAYSNTLYKLQDHLAEFNRHFDQYDLLMSPTSAGEAFHHNPKHHPIALDDQHVHYSDFTFAFVMPYNAMGHPVLVIPCQQDESKLPIGLQFIGRHYSENALLHFGGLMEAAGFKFRLPKL